MSPKPIKKLDEINTLSPLSIESITPELDLSIFCNNPPVTKISHSISLISFCPLFLISICILPKPPETSPISILES